MEDIDGGGYAVPIDYVWDGEECICVHCAQEGHKQR